MIDPDSVKTAKSEKERQAKVAFLGPAGTYTHAAAMQLFTENAEWLPVVDIPEIFSAVENGQADWGVVPVENSSEGSVLPTLDSFVSSALHINAELMMRIVHCLLASKETLASDITTIASHQQSLGQCRHWLKEHYPNVQLLTVSSNAEAARLASENVGMAAIAGKATAGIYGLQVVKEGVEDTHDNTTRFLAIGKARSDADSGNDKTSIIILTHNEPGVLFSALEPFHRHGVNLSKLESRPSRKEAWSYFFYLDIEGHQSSAKVAEALKELEALAIEVKLLGSYPAAVSV